MATDDERLVFEHQRHFLDRGWSDQLLPHDRFTWSDKTGSIDRNIGLNYDEWEIVISDDTDEEGWRYAAHFGALNTEREGGRKNKEKLDCVRQRCWSKRANPGRGLTGIREEGPNIYDHRIKMLTERLHTNLLECGMKETRFPPVEETDLMLNTPRCPIYLSSGWRTCRKLILMIQGAGGARPGMWSRTLCIEEGLNVGSMLPFVQRAISKQYGVIILNPFSNQAVQSGAKSLLPVAGCETPQKHVVTVWDTYVSQAKACDFYIIANGYGCELAIHLLESRSSQILSRLHAVAFAENPYKLRTDMPAAVKTCLRKRAINWCHKSPENVNSSSPRGESPSATAEVDPNVCITLFVDIQKKWDGNVSRTIAAAIKPIFKWFDHAASVPSFELNLDSNMWASSPQDQSTKDGTNTPTSVMYGISSTVTTVYSTGGKTSSIPINSKIAERSNDHEKSDSSADSRKGKLAAGEKDPHDTVDDEDDNGSAEGDHVLFSECPSPDVGGYFNSLFAPGGPGRRGSSLLSNLPGLQSTVAVRMAAFTESRSAIGINKFSATRSSLDAGIGAVPSSRSNSEADGKQRSKSQSTAPTVSLRGNRNSSPSLNITIISEIEKQNARRKSSSMLKLSNMSLTVISDREESSDSRLRSPITPDAPSRTTICPQLLNGKCRMPRSECPYNHGPIDPDYPNIIVGERAGSQGIPVIDAATVEEITKGICDPYHANYDFGAAFLITLPLFTTPLAVITLLVARFNHSKNVRDHAVSSLQALEDEVYKSPESFEDNDHDGEMVGLPLSLPSSPMSDDGECRSSARRRPSSPLLSAPPSSAPAVLSCEGKEIENAFLPKHTLTSIKSSKSLLSIQESKKNEGEVGRIKYIQEEHTKVLIKILAFMKSWLKQPFAVSDFGNTEAGATIVAFLEDSSYRDIPSFSGVSNVLLRQLKEINDTASRASAASPSVSPKYSKYDMSSFAGRGSIHMGSASLESYSLPEVSSLNVSSTSSSLGGGGSSAPFLSILSSSIPSIEFSGSSSSRSSISSVPPSDLTGDDGGDNFLLDNTPMGIAEQFALMDQEQLCNVESRELISYRVRSEAAGVKAIVESFNARMWWVVSEIVYGVGDAYSRADRMMFCIELAEACLELCNFSALFAITTALEHPSIGKLRSAWARVSDNHKRRLELLIPISKTTENYKRYRLEFKKCVGRPRLPACNVVFRNLFSIEESMSDTHNVYPHLLNFRKFRKIYDIISEWSSCKDNSYSSRIALDGGLRRKLELRIMKVKPSRNLWDKALLSEKTDSAAFVSTLETLGF